MSSHRLARRAVMLGMAAAVTGCSSANPNLYTIAPIQGTPQAGGPSVVLLREVALPHYLDRQQIVRSSENYRFTIQSNDWWGEGLSAMLNRVLVQELNQRLPGSMVYGENGAVSPSPNVTIELNMQRLDEDARGNLVLLAQAAVEVERGSARTRSFDLSVPVAGKDTPALVAAISNAVGQVADGLAAMARGS